jgi:predicted nucleotidyltransferase
VIYSAYIVNVEELGRRIIPVLRRFGVKRASLFGSSARGEEGEESDIDIIVEFDVEKSLLDLASSSIHRVLRVFNLLS